MADIVTLTINPSIDVSTSVEQVVPIHSCGRKQMRMVYARDHGGTRNVSVPGSTRERFCIDDAEVLKLAGYAIKIEDHHSAKAGHTMPMDIEWAKDADDGQLYVIQARPETVASRKAPTAFENYVLTASAPVLVSGRAVGEKIAAGPTRVIAEARELATFQPGEVLVAESTSPDWEPVMKIAAAIVTDRGGRTCHAAIVARELGVPAVVGAAGAKDALRTSRTVTVSCAEGDVGRVYDDKLSFETTRVETGDLKRPRTAIMLNLGNPELALRSAMLPNDGVGLARMEFIISEHIGVHQMALVNPEKVTPAAAQKAIQRLVRNYAGPADYFIVMCEIPNNVIQVNAFAELFDGFSIGSNDLTQLALGVDRDSEIVAFDFDERDPGMLEMLKLAVVGAKRNARHVGICGEAPANYPEVLAR